MLLLNSPTAGQSPCRVRDDVSLDEHAAPGLRVVPENLDGFWEACVPYGIERLAIQTEHHVWYKRSSSGWHNDEGVLEMACDYALRFEGLPDNDAKRIRYALKRFGVKAEELGKALSSLLFHGYDACVGSSTIPDAWTWRASDREGEPDLTPGMPPNGKLVELMFDGHGSGLFKTKYRKRTQQLACISKVAMELPSPNTLASILAQEPLAGPVGICQRE